jgi:hypothetical protein
MFERGGIWVSRPGWILFSGIAPPERKKSTDNGSYDLTFIVER